MSGRKGVARRGNGNRSQGMTQLATLRSRWRAAAFAVIATAWLAGCQSLQPLPEGVSFRGEEHAAGRLEFLADITYADPSGKRFTQQEIFDHWFATIAGARRFILIDMFLYNDFQGPVPEHSRALASELTRALIRQKRRHPDMRIVVITDPVNTVYGGVRPAMFDEIEAAGIELVITDLTKLRDSNPSWSTFWRLFVKPFGNSTKGWLPSPFSHEPVTVRSYLSFLNFKANHRKVLVADSNGGLAALVASGNTHDASSAHSNVALALDGPAAYDLLVSENAVIEFSGGKPVDQPPPPARPSSGVTVQILTESKVRDDVLATVGTLGRGDELDIAIFFISDREVIAALKAAHERGAAIRIMLDPNRTAFGFRRIGIPNGPVARELNAAGIDVRWCDPNGEQCHWKMLLARKTDGRAWMSIGSTNLTRRNLDDFNLETNVVLRGRQDARVFRQAGEWFETLWRNEPGRIYTAEYERHAVKSPLKAVLYHFMESSGWSTF